MDIQIIAQKFYDYSTFIRGYSKATIKRYKYVITFYCRFAGIESIDQVTDVNIRALFLHGRMDRHWKTNTYLVFYKSLLVFFRWCVKEGYMPSNPVEGMEKPKLEKLLPPKLTKQDALKVVEAAYNFPYTDPFLRLDKTHENDPFRPDEKGPLCHVKLTPFATAK